MNTKQSFALLGIAALCGIAFAQTPKPAPTAAERLDTLEKEMQALRAQFAVTMNQTAEANSALATLRQELAETRALANQSASWALVQAQGAAELEHVFADSEQKGFTFGINPESRVALLAGWRSFATGLQKDVPKPIASRETQALKDPKSPPSKKP